MQTSLSGPRVHKPFHWWRSWVMRPVLRPGQPLPHWLAWTWDLLWPWVGVHDVSICALGLLLLQPSLHATRSCRLFSWRERTHENTPLKTPHGEAVWPGRVPSLKRLTVHAGKNHPVSPQNREKSEVRNNFNPLSVGYTCYTTENWKSSCLNLMWLNDLSV